MEHHNPVSTIYSALENVPLILAPQFSALKPIIISQEFNLELPTVSKTDFDLERRIVAETERFRQENDGLAQIRAQKLHALHEERIRKQKEEARKIAPGFLDTDQKILTPTRASQQVENSSTVVHIGTEIDNQKRLHSRSASEEKAERTEEGEEVKARSLVHLFEESLPPRNPWDRPNSVQDDISILREMIVPSNGTQNYISNGHVTSPTVIGPYVSPEVPTNPTRSFHPSPLLQPVTMPLHQSPNHSFSLGPPLSTHSNAELSPSNNNYTLSSLNIRNTSSTNIQQRAYPTTTPYIRERRSANQLHVTHPIPPTRPPKEVISSSPSATTTTTIINSSLTNEESGEKNESFELIKEFTNMGFTKSQAVEALEKYNYDLHKATNYLLDMQQNY